MRRERNPFFNTQPCTVFRKGRCWRDGAESWLLFSHCIRAAATEIWDQITNTCYRNRLYFIQHEWFQSWDQNLFWELTILTCYNILGQLQKHEWTSSCLLIMQHSPYNLFKLWGYKGATLADSFFKSKCKIKLMHFNENVVCSCIFDGIKQKNGSKAKTSYHLFLFFFVSIYIPVWSFTVG